jgi:hypothetical protein
VLESPVLLYLVILYITYYLGEGWEHAPNLQNCVLMSFFMHISYIYIAYMFKNAVIHVRLMATKSIRLDLVRFTYRTVIRENRGERHTI